MSTSPDDDAPHLLDHVVHGRNARTVLVLASFWALLVWLRLALDAALWIVGGLALFALPALWDLVSDRRSGLRLTGDALHWRSGGQGDSIPCNRIKAVRLDRRLDLSYRVSVVLGDDRRVRLPQDCVPPIDRLAAALEQAGIRVERHPFSLL